MYTTTTEAFDDAHKFAMELVKLYNENQENLDAYEDLRFIMNLMDRIIRTAEEQGATSMIIGDMRDRWYSVYQAVSQV